MSQHEKLVVSLEVAIMAAFAMALTYLPHTTGVSAIELSYGLIPIGVLGLRRGMNAALMGGFIWGILDLFLRGLANGSVLNVWQGLLEFPIAFTLVGLMGITFRSFQRSLKAGDRSKAVQLATVALIVGTFAKYLMHFIAGVVFWGSYAPKGMNAWLYSLIVNGGSALFSTILAVVVVGILIGVAPQLFLTKSEQALTSKPV